MKWLIRGIFSLFLVSVCYAGNLTFEWVSNVESDMAGYRLYQSDVSDDFIRRVACYFLYCRVDVFSADGGRPSGYDMRRVLHQN